jgi:hypothetical protein
MSERLTEDVARRLDRIREAAAAAERARHLREGR